MKKLLTAVLLAGLFTACDYLTEETKKPSVLIISTKKIHKEVGNCASDSSVDCTVVDFNIHQLQGGDSAVSESINQALENEILRNYLNDSTSASLEEYADQFIADYKSIKARFDRAFGWENTVNTDIVRQDSILVIKTYIELYTGGAHGSSEVYYANFSLENGKLLALSDVFKGDYKSKLNEVVFKAFNQQTELISEEFFDDNKYYTENFGLLKDGIVFYYNSYEIAPYAAGPTEIKIGYEKLEGILR